MPPPLWWLVGGLVAAAAFVVRVGTHLGRSPGGVDTWYYLAYADAFRRRPRLDVRLPQYLLQDERQSYPPLFPSLLALLPPAWLRRWFFVVSPAVDCAHLLLLHLVAYKITDSLVVASVAASAYAVSPQLVSETRSLTPRPFGALLHTLALLFALKALASGPVWPWLGLAVAAGAALLLSSAAMSAAYGFVSVVLALVRQDVSFVLVAAAALAVALVVSGGHQLRVIRNYLHAVAYWRRNRRFFGAHPVRHSPLYGDPSGHAPAQGPGFLDGTPARQLLRLVGENPLLLALPLAPYGLVPWGPALYWWAVGLVLLSVVATLWPPLRAFGPGRAYMRAATFPAAYTIAAGIGTPAGFARPLGLAALACLALSLGAIAFFYVYVRTRKTEQTAHAPDGLRAAVAALLAAPPGGVFCLPYMYADYAGYHSARPILWGGHCGDLRALEAVAPVIIRPLPELFREHGVRWVLVDTAFVAPEELRLELEPRGAWNGFRLFETRA